MLLLSIRVNTEKTAQLWGRAMRVAWPGDVVVGENGDA
jgi:hypothetical protein